MLCSFAGLVCICIATLQFTFTIAVLCIQVCCCRSLLLKLKCLHVSKDRTRVCKQCLILATTCKRRLQKVFVSGLLLCRLAASQHTPDVRQQVHSRPRGCWPWPWAHGGFGAACPLTPVQVPEAGQRAAGLPPRRTDAGCVACAAQARALPAPAGVRARYTHCACRACGIPACRTASFIKFHPRTLIIPLCV